MMKIFFRSKKNGQDKLTRHIYDSTYKYIVQFLKIVFMTKKSEGYLSMNENPSPKHNTISVEADARYTNI